ncbi:MAG: hypothetical protein H6997_03005 [Moraxellaceae bacterium]|nr:hypothetical protein [Moraxellaceae bacterium]
MKSLPFAPKILSIAILTTLLAACGGGGSDDSPAVTSSTITGTAVKGLMQSAKVTAYKVIDGKKGDKLTDTTTDNNGAYTLTVSGYSGAVILEMTADTNTKMLCDIPAGCEGGIVFGAATSANGLVLQTVLGELKANNKTAITPFTHLATKFAESKGGGFNKTNIEIALTQIADLFNLPALNDTVAVNPAGNLQMANTSEQQYAIMNAAIAQLAGKVADISTKLNALSAEINSKNGQLQSSGAAGFDLADVLAAAKDVAESNQFKTAVNGAVKTILAAQLELANKNTDVTNATPTTGAGLDDLAKAKAFVNSASLLLSTLQQYDDQSFIDTAANKVKAIQALTDGDSLIFDALGAVTVVMASAVEESQETRQLATAQLNTLFGNSFNNGELEAIASNDLRLSIDASTNTAVLNGEVKLQRKKRQYNNGVWTLVNDGTAKGFTVTNFKISYPSKTATAKEFSVAIDANSKIKTANVEFGFASGSQSRVVAYFDTANTLQSHIDVVDEGGDLHTPTKVEAKLDRVTLKVLNAPANEISQFVGNATLTGKRLNLDTTTGGKRLWPMPDLATLSGKFSSVDGDMVESTASVALSETNPLVSPEQNFINTGFYNYQYNAANNTITLKPKKGTVYYSNATQVVLSMESQNCSAGQKRLMANVGYSWLGNCSTNTDVAAAYKEFVTTYNYWWALRTNVDSDGTYIPVYPANFNYKSTNTNVDGKLIYSEDTLSEDATHQVKGTITANTKIKLVGSAAADIEALVTANYAGQQNGNLTMTVRAGDEKIDVTGTTQNGKTTVKLSNKNGVSIDVAESTSDANKLELKVNGSVQGWVYKLNGAPVVKFKDDKIKFL